MKRHVALVGFMAAGKSTVGRRLARRLRCAFFDTDELVVRAHGRVADIFAREGEAAFRRYEREALERALEGAAGVVALGGGALTVAENRAALQQRAHRVFLKASPEQILARVLHGHRPRPLLGARPTLARIRELYDVRISEYASADHVVDAYRMSDREVLDDILQWLSEQKIALRA